jgi:RimJ/RimL family protein N-acetyltransferase
MPRGDAKSPLVPRLETARLVLSGHVPDDLAACAAMWGDPRVTKHIGGRPLSREETWAKILRYAGHWALLGFGYWAVREKGSERYVGEVGLCNFKIDMSPSLDGYGEIGWALDPSMHGMGYATEAGQAALAWFGAHFPTLPTACMIDPGNDASVRVAARLGYAEWTRATYHGEETVLFSRAAAAPP